MKKMKKWISLLLVLNIILCFAGCAEKLFVENTTGESTSAAEYSEKQTAETTAEPVTEMTEAGGEETKTEENTSAGEENADETTAEEASEEKTSEVKTSEEKTEAASGNEVEEETERTSEEAVQTEPENETPAKPERFTTADEAINRMSIEEKVGQLFVITPEALYPYMRSRKISESSADYAYTLSEGMKGTYELYPAGGFILFGGNISGAGQLKSFINELHSVGRVRPFVYIDEEGGSVARLGNSDHINVPTFGNMQSIAETGSADSAYAVGSGIGGYLKEYGIDLDFAPVADVNTNPDNPVIGRRAFGSDPVIAGKMVAAVIDGLHSQGVGSCIKHFPGHGDTSTDTHTGYAETKKKWDEIKECEMIPFINGINAGTDMVMVAHIAAPNVTGSNIPATLSYTLVTEKLRGELGYNGVVITDSMSMGAIAAAYSPAQAALSALKAGVDIILIPDNYAEAFNSILTAVKSGEISEERLNASVRRILEMKF